MPGQPCSTLSSLAQTLKEWDPQLHEIESSGCAGPAGRTPTHQALAAAQAGRPFDRYIVGGGGQEAAGGYVTGSFARAGSEHSAAAVVTLFTFTLAPGSR